MYSTSGRPSFKEKEEDSSVKASTVLAEQDAPPKKKRKLTEGSEDNIEENTIGTFEAKKTYPPDTFFTDSTGKTISVQSLVKKFKKMEAAKQKAAAKKDDKEQEDQLLAGMSAQQQKECKQEKALRNKLQREERKKERDEKDRKQLSVYEEAAALVGDENLEIFARGGRLPATVTRELSLLAHLRFPLSPAEDATNSDGE